MRTEEVIIKTYEERIVTCVCDKCGVTSKGQSYHDKATHKCGTCEGDFCKDCIVWYYPEYKDESPNIYGFFCRECLDKVKDTILEIERLTREHKKSIEHLTKLVYPHMYIDDIEE